MTLARFYVLSASANFIFSATMTVFAVTKGYSELAVMSGVMVVLSIAEWCWAYGNYLLIDVHGNNGSATIECNPGGDIENGTTYSPANPGPLKPEVADSFSGGTYTEKVLASDTTFYRVYGGEVQKVGQYMTRIPQNGGLQSQIDLALNPDWGNTAQYVIKVTVPKGTIIYEGTAASQVINGGAGQLIGGGNQIFIPWEELDSLWFGN